MDFGVKNSIFRVSASYFDQKGYHTLENDFKRITIKVSNTTKIGKKIDFSPAVTYTNSQNNKVLRGAGGFMLSLLSWPSDKDIVAQQGDNASKDVLFTATPNQDYDNPFFNVKNNPQPGGARTGIMLHSVLI